MGVPEFFTYAKLERNIVRMLNTDRDMPPVWLQ